MIAFDMPFAEVVHIIPLLILGLSGSCSAGDTLNPCNRSSIYANAIAYIDTASAVRSFLSKEAAVVLGQNLTGDPSELIAVYDTASSEVGGITFAQHFYHMLYRDSTFSKHHQDSLKRMIQFREQANLSEKIVEPLPVHRTTIAKPELALYFSPIRHDQNCVVLALLLPLGGSNINDFRNVRMFNTGLTVLMQFDIHGSLIYAYSGKVVYN
jgi:hypothetical protein